MIARVNPYLTVHVLQVPMPMSVHVDGSSSSSSSRRLAFFASLAVGKRSSKEAGDWRSSGVCRGPDKATWTPKVVKRSGRGNLCRRYLARALHHLTVEPGSVPQV